MCNCDEEEVTMLNVYYLIVNARRMRTRSELQYLS